MILPTHPAPFRLGSHKVLRWLDLVATLAVAASASAQVAPDLTSGQFAPNCGNATAAPIFDAAKMNTGAYGVTNLIAVSDPDIVLIGNQWWMIFATGPGQVRAIEPFAAYLPPGASLSTSTTYPSDPNGWRLVGAKADGTGIAIPISPTPSSWDYVAAETPSADAGPNGGVSVYYSGHNAGQTAFQVGLMSNFVNGSAGANPTPVMSAVEPWEFSSGQGAVLEQSVRWMPQLNKFIMYYTAGAWWASPPDNAIAYADSTDGINWINRQRLDFPASYYNQDFLYNPNYNRYEMVLSNDATGAGGANPRNLVWRDAATPAVAKAGWVNEVTLLQYDTTNNAPWYNSGLLSPAVKYGNLAGEQNRIYVFFHSYTLQGDMFIGRFYCDPVQLDFSISAAGSTSMTVAPGSTANYTLNLAPTSGNYPGTVSFSLSGLPPDATYMLSPSTLPASAGPQTVSLAIAIPATSSGNRAKSVVPTVLCLLLPLACWRRARQNIAKNGAAVLLLAASAVIFVGCGSSGTPVQPQTHNVTVAAASGSTMHFATLVLQVQ